MKRVILILAITGFQSAVSDYDMPSTMCDGDKIYQESNNCGRTCNDLQGNNFCNEPMRWDCFCRSNTFLRSDGQCVDSADCYQMPNNQFPSVSGNDGIMQCGGGMEWFGADPNCGYQCNNYADHLVGTCDMPSSPGCYCPFTFYLSSSGRCLSPAECDEESSSNSNPANDMLTCSGGQQYFDCDPNCGRRCDNFVDRDSDDCSQDCVSGCYCVSGQLLNSDGQCVNTNECQQPLQDDLDDNFDDGDT